MKVVGLRGNAISELQLTAKGMKGCGRKKMRNDKQNSG